MSDVTAKRVVIATRVSTADQADHGTSLATQERELRAEAARRGWRVVAVYEEAAVSGAARQGDRPAFKALLADAHAGKFDVLLVDKWDRLARNLNEQTSLWAALDDLGVEYVSLSEPNSSGKDGKFVRHIMAAVAEQERDRIRDRTRAGVNARVRAGGWGGGNVAPFGYRIVGVDALAHLEVDEREAEVVRAAVAMVLDMRLSTLDAAKRLNASGLTPRSAALWTSQNLRNCLRRGQWDGRWIFGKTSPKGTVPQPIEVAIQPILNADRADALRRHLKHTTLVRGSKGVHPLTGRLRCLCGEPMTGIARGDRANRRYRCRHGRREPGRPFCGHPSVLADAVDAAVWAEVVMLLADPEHLLILARERLGLLEVAQDVEADALAEAEKVVSRSQDRLAKAAAKCIALDLDEETTRATIQELQEQHQAALDHRALVTASRSQTVQARRRMVTAEELAQVALHRLVGADPSLQAQVFALLDVRATVVAHSPTLALRVEGSVMHELLLKGMNEEVAPGELASAAG